ncbi:MAG: right-handed parallel beta-helix repeat-containing protein [Opitutaceae bacterium]|nr:right-handed parallel beta-helix repeat-containing protein [Verrucomicrobiales bacterium]
MHIRFTKGILRFLGITLCMGSWLHANGASVYNVRDFGATGQKADDARPAIQQAIDACAANKGGTVVIPPGEYTSGTLHLRSHVRIEIAAGATLFASKDPSAYYFKSITAQAALFFGEDVEDVTITGKGTVNGQAEYEWREDDFEQGFNHKETMHALGKSLLRSFPKGHPKREIFPRLVWLGRSRNLTFTGLKWLHSPSWTFTLYDCQRAQFDGLYIHTSLKEGVWADGIDLDGCKDVSIANCTIETGDDCIIFISSDVWGPARRCENITVTGCRLSSASAGVKFSEGNKAGVRNVRVSDCVLTNVNRGFVFYSTTKGGDIRDVELSRLTIHCNRFDWFWAGDGQPFHFRVVRVSELNKEPAKPGELPPGVIRNITIRDVTAHAKGTSRVHGHRESPLDKITFENVRLFLAADPDAAFDYADDILDIRWAKNLRIKDLEVSWGNPQLKSWQSALHLQEIAGLQLDGFAGRGAPDQDAPSVVLNQVSQAVVRNSRATAGTTVFLKATGPGSRGIRVQGNDFRSAQIPYVITAEVPAGAVRILGNRFPDAWRH